MSVVSEDLQFYLTGAGSDGGVQVNPNASLGGFRSSTLVVDSSLHNLFDQVSGGESSAGDSEYRCVCLKNTNLTSLFENVKIWLLSGTGNVQDIVSFAIEVPTGGDQVGSAQTVADEDTAPTVSAGNVGDWSTATSETNAETVEINAHSAHLGAEELVFVWLRRSIAVGSSAANNEGITLNIKGQAQ